MKQTRLIYFVIGIIYFIIYLASPAYAQVGKIQQRSQCDLNKLKQYEADFDKLIQIKTLQGDNDDVVFARDMEIAALKYIKENEACFHTIQDKSSALSGNATHIDEGGVWMTENNSLFQGGEFNLFGTKWGGNSPFPRGNGQNVNGPGTTGGVVTYSFMANGVSHAVEGVESNTNFRSLATYRACFETEITRAFAMWSAVANIDFRLVGDNGRPSNSSGASGQIRIGAHSFDGRSGTLAHAFFPPPNGNTIAGDMHFDRAEQWTCDTSGLDIGIVATHEIGHAIGLNHEEQGATAIMNPFYNPNVPSLTSDDISGAQSIYGGGIELEPEPAIPSAIVSFLDDDFPIVIPFDRDPIDDRCNTTIGLDPVIFSENRTWVSGCVSRNRAPALAQFYSFTLSEQTNVTINLRSVNVDTYLFLLRANRTVLAFNDDDGVSLNSAITRTLPAGRYFIEATTFSSADFSGDGFTVIVRSN